MCYVVITVSYMLAAVIARVLASSLLCKVANLAKLGQARGKEDETARRESSLGSALPKAALCLWTRENLALPMLTRSLEPALTSLDVSALCL